MHRAGRFAADRVSADLGEAVHGGWRPMPGAAVYFSSFGLNVFDVALAARLLGAAEAAGRGALRPIFGLTDDRAWPWM
jgi:ornithine cyclodeaminase